MSQTSPETEALSALVAKLEEIHEHPRFKAVWEIAHYRLGPYDGPTYTQELAAAKETLSKSGHAPTQQQPNARREGMVSAFNEVADYLQEQKLYAYAEHIRKRAVSLSSTLQGGNDA